MTYADLLVTLFSDAVDPAGECRTGGEIRIIGKPILAQKH